ncbi:MAG: HD domain-containing protein [Spirochaetaceae bacterium]|nr:HD domain-containing protein [Spirochaetaceae bacterium]
MPDNVIEVLSLGYTEPIRDPLWGHIYLTPEIEDLTRTKAFMRLYRISQLGPASLLYPGATHSRAAHSIGVYHLTRRLLINLAERGAAAWLTSEGVRSMLCAALLHDLGHFPYAHSLKDLPLTDHEVLSGRSIMKEPLRSVLGKTGASPELTAAIIDNNLPANGNKELLFYRKLLSGCLDPDKLDYLNRDARYCGVPYGAQDVDFTISMLYPHIERGVDIDSRGISSVESVLFSKYLMYRSVYWHRSVRSATSMIKKALFSALKDGSIRDDDLYALDDNGLFTLLDFLSSSLSALARDVRDGYLYAVAEEYPFNEAEHGRLEDINEREKEEAVLAEKFSILTGKKVLPKQVIIDLPNNPVFETDLYVLDEECSFGESSSFFKKHTVASFVKTLRIVRIYVDRRAGVVKL